MSEQEAKCHCVSDLLDVEIAPETISTIIRVTVRTVRNIRAAKKEGNDVSRKRGSGENGLKHSDDFLESLKAKIEDDLTMSMRRLADYFDVNKSTIRKAVHEDLGLRSYICVPRHLLTTSLKARRLERCRKVLCYLKSNAATVKIFSDKKIFTVDQVLNCRNDRFIAESSREVEGTFRTKHPAQVM